MKLGKLFKNKIFLSVFLAFSIFAFILLWTFNLLNKNIQKSFFNYDPNKTDNRIILLTIDEQTVQKLWRFPFDRKYYWKLIENLNKAWASVIAFDIIFADPSNLESDKIFENAVKNAWNVVLWWATLDKWSIEWEFEKPIKGLFDNAFDIWSFNVTIDPLMNIVFSIKPFKNFANGYYEYFWISILRAYYSKIYNDEKYLTQVLNITDDKITINEKIDIPLSSKWNKNDVLINFTKEKFKSFSMLQITEDDQFNEIQRTEGEKFLEDKIVLVWATLRGQDIIKNPISSLINDDLTYWVYVHANFLNTILIKNFSKYFNRYNELVLILLLTILSIYINLNKWWFFLVFSNFAIISILWLYFISIKILHLVLNFPSELIISFFISLILSNIVKYLIENKDKIKLNKALSEYVSKDIAAEILSWAWIVNLDWEKKRMAIFFSDIEWFTSISENFSPEELISFLKDYLNNMSDIIMNQKWFINKYEWDAIMALWWVFKKTTENISFEACECALIQRNSLIEFNKKWKSLWLPTLNVRIWIHTGEAIIWNIWSKWKKMEFTAIWDNVNLASRLEAINKYYSTYMCVSEAVYLDVKDFFEFRHLDKIKVKWKNNAVNIYELLDYKWKLTKFETDIYSKFQDGIDLYLKEEFESASKIFSELSTLGDKPSIVYKNRCDDLLKNPIQDWDWTWVMLEK